MDVIKTLAAGKPGTQRHVPQYGDRLRFVRHRHGNGRRHTTIELIVDERPDGVIYRSPPEERRPMPGEMLEPRKPIAVRVGVQKLALRETVKQNGGRWDADRKAWWLPADAVRRLGLQDRATTVWMWTKMTRCRPYWIHVTTWPYLDNMVYMWACRINHCYVSESTVKGHLCY
ncbi:MAG: hypothetical protein KDI42_04985 [Gammaproteobacteria bacterium]|nr:hypothetical protein [Nitrospira sp.]MCB1737458.1 hypothetical protein [Gammaproteobacteria bacterium]